MRIKLFKGMVVSIMAVGVGAWILYRSGVTL